MIGIILSVPIKVEILSVGEKPPFLFALLLSIILLTMSAAGSYISFLSWFGETKFRTNFETSIEKLGDEFPFFRLPIYNPTLIFWFIRLIVPIASFLIFGLFLLVLFSAF